MMPPESLQQDLAAALAEVAILREELDQTNQGVVALYAELDDRAEQLRQVSDLKSRFLSYMSHEFRTPLVAILSMTRLLTSRLDGPLSSEQETQVDFIHGAAEELRHMVDDLLDLAKVEAGRITVSPAWFNLIDLFSALRGMFRPIAEPGAVTMTFVEPRDMPQMFSDNQKVAQILRNFISNALKFTASGTITVAATREADGFVRFTVTDTGPGIAEKDFAALFQDFSPVRSKSAQAARGTGLGLSLSRRFAELLGGRVEVQSQLGVGSSFHAILPTVGLSDVDKEHAA